MQSYRIQFYDTGKMMYQIAYSPQKGLKCTWYRVSGKKGF
mgnify:FL=1